MTTVWSKECSSITQFYCGTFGWIQIFLRLIDNNTSKYLTIIRLQIKNAMKKKIDVSKCFRMCVLWTWSKIHSSDKTPPNASWNVLSQEMSPNCMNHSYFLSFVLFLFFSCFVASFYLRHFAYKLVLFADFVRN